MGDVGNAFAGKGASGVLGCMSSISTALCRLSENVKHIKMKRTLLQQKNVRFHVPHQYLNTHLISSLSSRGPAAIKQD